MDCIFSNHSYQQWLRIKNCWSKHNHFVKIKSGLFSIFLVKQHNAQKWPKNSYIFLILEPIGRFVLCKKCSPPNMANKMSLNSNLDHHLCLIFQIWLHNNASWQKGHLIVHLATAILKLISQSMLKKVLYGGREGPMVIHMIANNLLMQGSRASTAIVFSYQ